MAKVTKLLTPDEMREIYDTFPVWVEQLRAKIVKGLSDGPGIVPNWARQVDPGRRFLQKVKAFGRNQLPYLDLWEMMALYAVITAIQPPRFPRAQSGLKRNGRKPGTGFPKSKVSTIHKALVD